MHSASLERVKSMYYTAPDGVLLQGCMVCARESNPPNTLGPLANLMDTCPKIRGANQFEKSCFGPRLPSLIHMSMQPSSHRVFALQALQPQRGDSARHRG